MFESVFKVFDEKGAVFYFIFVACLSFKGDRLTDSASERKGRDCL